MKFNIILISSTYLTYCSSRFTATTTIDDDDDNDNLSVNINIRGKFWCIYVFLLVHSGFALLISRLGNRYNINLNSV